MRYFCDKDTLAIIVDVSNKERVDNQSFMSVVM